MGPGDPDFEAAAACGQQQAGSMTLVAVLLCTLVRGAKLQEAKARALQPPTSFKWIMPGYASLDENRQRHALQASAHLRNIPKGMA